MSQSLILVIEDNHDDAKLLRRAFIKAKVLNPLHVLHNAEQAVGYLKGDGIFKNRAEFPLPGLILLDLKLPGMSGVDFLIWLRAQPGLQSLRVVVLSASDDMRDVSQAYQCGANSFLIKPADFERFVEISQALNGYWLWLEKTPEGSDHAEMQIPGERESGSARN